MISAIFFDLDNTLIDRDRAFEATIAEVFSDKAVRKELRNLDKSGQGSRENLFAVWALHAKQEMNQKLFVQELLTRLAPDPILLSMLRALKKTHKLGVISNGGSLSQRLKMEATGLETIFPVEHVWISGDLGFEKPDSRIFQMAARQVGEKPENCLYAGDLPDVDGRGALEAGFQFLMSSPESLRTGVLCKV